VIITKKNSNKIKTVKLGENETTWFSVTKDVPQRYLIMAQGDI